MQNLPNSGSLIRHEILAATIPDDLAAQIVEAYHQLSQGRPELLDVAVRSSATAEDLPDASFAGQQETYLNVTGSSRFWSPASDASPRSSRIGRSRIASTRVSITSRSRFRSAFSGWCDRILHHPA